MNARLFASLYSAIDAWVDNNADTVDWPNVVIGDDTVTYMAKAAAHIIDACTESQEYGVDQGLLGSSK